MTGASPVVDMAGVSKRFDGPEGEVHVLSNLHLRVRDGEFVALTGPSGSGKSTCLHLAALLDKPSAGEVTFEGSRISSLDEEELSRLRAGRIGMVFQQFWLLPHRSVFQNVLFRYRYLEHDPSVAEERAMEALRRVGLLQIARRQARQLSGGEMQRTAIARAIALEPRLLVADEPTGNLDRAAAAGVMDVLAALNGKGMTILMVTHNEALLDVCSRRLRLADGCLCDGGQ